MKKIMLSLLLLPFLAFAPGTDPLPIGAAVPKSDLSLKDISGRNITLKTVMKENGLLVMFSSNTCPYVMRNQARTKQACQYALDKQIGVVLLNANEGGRDDEESPEAMKQFAAAHNYKWYYAVDKNSELANAFGANRTPECFLFDKNGTLVYHGAIDDNPADEHGVNRHHLKEAMDEMLSGKTVTVKQSRSVGCNIKRNG